MNALFTNKDTWNGGYYELAIEMGERNDERLEVAIQSLWNHSSLEGCFSKRDIAPSQQNKIIPSLSNLNEHGHLRGLATLPNSEVIPCGMTTVIEVDGPDWLDFYIPMGALEMTLENINGFPFDNSSECKIWREPIDEWFTELALLTYMNVNFSLGIIGHEVSGDSYSDEVNINRIPEERYVRYLIPDKSELRVVGVTKWA